jgi:non-reducing end alpha-L-arabinofuranosidase
LTNLKPLDIAHSGTAVNTQVVSSSSSAALKGQASWIVRAGLSTGKDCYSFESKDTPGNFLRHSNYAIVLNKNDGSKIFAEDATYCSEKGLNGQGNSLRSWSYPTRYFRHYAANLYIGSNGGPHTFDGTTVFNDDVTYAVVASFA